MSFVFFCRIGTCRPCARGVSGAGLRLLNVRRAKILFSAVIFFLPAAIFRPPSAFPPAPNPLFPVSFAPFDPPSAFLSPFLSSRLFRPPPSSFPFFPFVPACCLPLSRLPFPFRFPRDLVPAPSAVFLFPGLSRPSPSLAASFRPRLPPSSLPSSFSLPLPLRPCSRPLCCLPLSRPLSSVPFPCPCPPRPPSYLSPVLLVPSRRLSSLRTDSENGSVSCISRYYSLSCRSFILIGRHGLFPVG